MAVRHPSTWCPSAPASAWRLAAGLCGLGQGRATASATEALARNPGARAGIMTLLVLGLAFIESLTLFTLVIVFAKVPQVRQIPQQQKAAPPEPGGASFLL